MWLDARDGIGQNLNGLGVVAIVFSLVVYRANNRDVAFRGLLLRLGGLSLINPSVCGEFIVANVGIGR